MASYLAEPRFSLLPPHQQRKNIAWVPNASKVDARSSSKHTNYAADDELPVRWPKQRRIAESDRRRAVRASVFRYMFLSSQMLTRNSCDGCRRQKERCEGEYPVIDVPALYPRVSTRSALIDNCVQAAQEVIDICRCLRDDAGLARASYTEFRSCRAALLVGIAWSLHRKTLTLKEALQDGMSMIQMMSAGGDSARSETNIQASM